MCIDWRLNVQDAVPRPSTDTVGHTTASVDSSVFCANGSFLWALRSARSKTGRAVPSVENRCTYTKEKKRASGLGAQAIHYAGYTKKLLQGEERDELLST